MAESGAGITKFLSLLVLLILHWFSTMFEMVIQTVIFATALFYLLQTRISVLHYVDEFLAVIDSSKMAFNCIDRVLR